nr:MAG TPA: hypothetical protein [Caudoviricetes sp.]
MTSQKRRAGGAYRQKARLTALHAKPGKDRSKARRPQKAESAAYRALGSVEQLAGLAKQKSGGDDPGSHP